MQGSSALGIPLWCRTLGDEPAEALAILSQDSVKHVDERRQSERAQDAAEWSGKLELGEQHDAPTPVARDWRPIAEDEPPTFSAPFLRHRGEQVPGLLIGERKQCQLFTSIKRGDEPRRPTAEPSAAGIEQNGPPEVRDARYARAHALSTLSGRTLPRPRLHLNAGELLRRHISYELGCTTVDSATDWPPRAQERAATFMYLSRACAFQRFCISAARYRVTAHVVYDYSAQRASSKCLLGRAPQ